MRKVDNLQEQIDNLSRDMEATFTLSSNPNQSIQATVKPNPTASFGQGTKPAALSTYSQPEAYATILTSELKHLTHPKIDPNRRTYIPKGINYQQIYPAFQTELTDELFLPK